jgi:hypothetical protein
VDANEPARDLILHLIIRQPTPQPYSFILSFVYSTFEIAGKTTFKNTSDQCKMPITLSTNLRTNHNPLVAEEEEEEETDFAQLAMKKLLPKQVEDEYKDFIEDRRVLQAPANLFMW